MHNLQPVQFAVSQTTTSCSSRMERRAHHDRAHHTVAYLRSNVPEFTEPENWPPNSPDLNPADVDSVVADGVTSQNFEHWSAESSSDRLLQGSTKPAHTKPSDWSAAKRLTMVIKAKGDHAEFRLD